MSNREKTKGNLVFVAQQQNKDGQNEKRKNTGNMCDPKHDIVGTKEKNRMEQAHIENGRRSTSKKRT